MAGGKVDLANLSPSELAVAREAVRLGLTIDDLQRAAGSVVARKMTTDDVISEMLEAKCAAAGDTRWIEILKQRLKPLSLEVGKLNISEVSATDIERSVSSNPRWSPKTRANVRAAAVQLFEWARDREYLPDKKTEAAKSEAIAVEATPVEIYRPEDNNPNKSRIILCCHIIHSPAHPRFRCVSPDISPRQYW